jgi:hypothetical protein
MRGLYGSIDIEVYMNRKLIEEVEGIKDVEGIVSRTRNTRLVDLTEGDILVRDGEPYHVSWGEVSVYADGVIDEAAGELVLVDEEALARAVSVGAQVFNMEDI